MWQIKLLPFPWFFLSSLHCDSVGLWWFFYAHPHAHTTCNLFSLNDITHYCDAVFYQQITVISSALTNLISQIYQSSNKRISSRHWSWSLTIMTINNWLVNTTLFVRERNCNWHVKKNTEGHVEAELGQILPLFLRDKMYNKKWKRADGVAPFSQP